MARVLISMPESFLGKIDEVADEESRSRSELIREALRAYITKNQRRRNGLADKNAKLLEALLS
ncbi:MAG: ribbon-helix-helix protein, CopG family [bacterium]|nr:ribbon-helix-helix protein, CopG family [bacterium]